MRGPTRIKLIVNRTSGDPIFSQISQSIREQIIDGSLEEGTRLPASRNLAVEIGVSRSTVVTAYEQLVAEGYAIGAHGSGLYVCSMGEVELSKNDATTRRTSKSKSRRSAKEQSILPRLPKPLQPNMPDMRLFPYRKWAQCVARVSRSAPEALVSSGHLFGDPHLREAISEHIAEWRGVSASADQVVITAGSVDALELCVRSLMSAKDTIALEDPGYIHLRRFVSGLGLSPHWLPVDDAGAELPRLGARAKTPKMAVVTPSHQFPLGGSMTPARRIAYLDWSAKNDAWIVEDDYDSEFRYAGQPIPALASLDQLQRTIYIGSFSKAFSHDLRLGYLALPEQLTSVFADTLTKFGMKASIAPQRALAAFMNDGDFYRHIRRCRRVYGVRRRALINLLQQHLGSFTRLLDHNAGMQMVLQLPDNYDDQAVSQAMIAKGFATPALSTYYARRPCARGLLLGFCAFTDEEMTKSVLRLKAVLKRHGPST